MSGKGLGRSYADGHAVEDVDGKLRTATTACDYRKMLMLQGNDLGRNAGVRCRNQCARNKAGRTMVRPVEETTSMIQQVLILCFMPGSMMRFTDDLVADAHDSPGCGAKSEDRGGPQRVIRDRVEPQTVRRCPLRRPESGSELRTLKHDPEKWGPPSNRCCRTNRAAFGV